MSAGEVTDGLARAEAPGGIEVVRTGRMPWGESMVKHRQAGSMRHKRLFDGDEGTPDNYHLAYADELGTYYSPSHRHLWDQVRICTEGAVPIGRTMQVGAGEIAYFPEGVRYGPQEGGPDRRVVVLQFGGTSRNGYLSPEQLERGRTELGEAGRFEGGLFHRTDGDGRAQQDAYEAVWEQVVGAPAVYPAAVVEAPIVLRPGAFPARPVAGADGVRRRRLGIFEPRGLRIDVDELDAGASIDLRCDDGVVLGWVLSGTGDVDGSEVEAETALRCRAGDAGVLRADTPLSVVVIAIPSLA